MFLLLTACEKRVQVHVSDPAMPFFHAWHIPEAINKLAGRNIVVMRYQALNVLGLKWTSGK
jgi:hypothetical protein